MGGKTPDRTYRSEIAGAFHEMMEGFEAAGVIERQTMRDFDDTCLAPAETLSPEEIRAIREREQVSQPVFARYLNVSRNLVSDWERGVKRPGGPALRLLSVVRKNGLRAIA
jgi:putative transcriptional regulator